MHKLTNDLSLVLRGVINFKGIMFFVIIQEFAVLRLILISSTKPALLLYK